MISSSHPPKFLGNCALWNKIAVSDLHLVLCGGVPVKDPIHCPNRFQIRDKVRVLALSSATKKGPYHQVDFVPGSLSKIIKTLEQELCCKRFKYHGRLVPLLDKLETFEGRKSFMDLVRETNQVILNILKLPTKVVLDLQTDITEDLTDGFLAPFERHLNGEGSGLYAGVTQTFNITRIPHNHIVYKQHIKDENRSSVSVVQLIAQEEDPHTELLKMASFERVV